MVSTAARDTYGPTVARDGTLVYKTQEYRTFLGELVDGGVRPLTTFQAETPWWHPTQPLLSMTYGTWRRQIDDANYPDIAQEVGVIDVARHLPADRPAQVLEDSDSEDQGMAWSPNGRWIVFHSHREHVRRRVAAAHRRQHARSPHHHARPRRRGGMAALVARWPDACCSTARPRTAAA